MSTHNQETSYQVFQIRDSETAVLIIARQGEKRFLRRVELAREDLPPQASMKDISHFVRSRADEFTIAIEKRLARYAALTTRTLRIKVHDFNCTVEVQVKCIDDTAINYSFLYGNTRLECKLRFDPGNDHHVFYVNDEGLSPSGKAMLASCVTDDISVYIQLTRQPLAAIHEYVSHRPPVPAVLHDHWVDATGLGVGAD